MTYLSKKTSRTPLFTNSKEESPNFLLKLYNILDTPEYSDIIQWDPTGQMVVMKKINQFTEKILPVYYKHSNYSSFVRQLNMYDFHKKKNNSNEKVFLHSVFNKENNRDIIKTIKRKNIKKKGRQATNSLRNIRNDNGRNDTNINIDINGNDNEIIDLSIDIENDVIGKKATKVSMENTLSLLVKRMNYYNERQIISNSKICDLNEKNEICLKSNNQFLKEYVSKTEYKTKLEAIIMLIIEVILKKPQMKHTSGLNEPKSRKNSDALNPQQHQTLNHNETHQKESSSMASLFNFLNYKQSSFNALNQIIAKNSNLKHANDYLMLHQPSHEYQNMHFSNNSPIKSKMMTTEDSLCSNELSLINNSLFNVSKLSTMNNGLMTSNHTNINRIGEDGLNISIHSKNIFDFDSDDCIINTVNDLSYNQ